jgi:hypothetical protein
MAALLVTGGAHGAWAAESASTCFAADASDCTGNWAGLHNSSLYTDWINVDAGARILVQMTGNSTSANATLTADVGQFPAGEEDSEESWTFTGTDVFDWSLEAPMDMRVRVRVDNMNTDDNATLKVSIGSKPVLWR